jgi:hypothetical protein
MAKLLIAKAGAFYADLAFTEERVSIRLDEPVVSFHQIVDESLQTTRLLPPLNASRVCESLDVGHRVYDVDSTSRRGTTSLSIANRPIGCDLDLKLCWSPGSLCVALG